MLSSLPRPLGPADHEISLQSHTETHHSVPCPIPHSEMRADTARLLFVLCASCCVGLSAPPPPALDKIHHVCLRDGSLRDACRKIPARKSIDRPFIVLTETKSSYRHIPVWARYSPHRTRVDHCVCLLLQDLLQSCARRGRRIMEDMCYEMGPVRNQILYHRVRLFSLVPLVWESNPKLQGGWCKIQPPG
jgi:hypothetical protein